MSIHQVKGEQHKVRPVLDFRELNKGVASLSGGMSTCAERLREWRTRGLYGSVVDLKRAYLQVHMARDLWVYQAVCWKGLTYLLTRLGFGLCVAPRVMTAIVEKVLGLDEEIRALSSSYVDDIFVTGERGNAEKVRDHLERYGLVTKEAAQLGDRVSVRVLGLRIDEQLP